MNAGCWAELGIEPTNDARAIRRAYAVRLKATRPEADPEGFTHLRAAFESALRLASAGRATIQANAQPGAVFARPLAVTVEPMVRPASNDPENAADAVRRQLSIDDVAGAAAGLASAIERGSFPLDVEIQLKDVLLRALVDDRRLDGEALKAVAGQFGWTSPGGPGDANLLRSLDAKLEAWDWYAEMQRQATSRRYWLGDEDAAAARVMTGRSDPFARIMPPVLNLKLQLGLLRYHGRWLGHRFEQAPIERAQKLASRRYPGLLGRTAWVVAVLAALLLLLVATPMILLVAVFRLPRVRIQNFSRPGLFAFVAMAVMFAVLALILPTSLPLIANASDTSQMGAAMAVDCVILLAVIVGIKQLFLPGKRTR